MSEQISRVEKPWGYELHWAKTDRYVGKLIHVNAGHALSLQYHNIKDETIYLQSGKMLFEIEVGGAMIGEFDIGGVFIPSPAVWAAVAIVVGMFVRRLLNLVGFYRLVWHRGLFELALLAILWGSVTWLATIYGAPDTMNLH